jgi:hypothetical protein
MGGGFGYRPPLNERKGNNMWIKEDIEQLNIDIDLLSQELILGPSNMVNKKIAALNRRWITNTYVSGNRSYLEPLEPLRFTKKYRWSPGYKDIVKQVTIERLLQLEKPGTLSTMRSRMNNQEWNMKYFWEDLMAIEDLMKELRSRKASTDDDMTSAKNNLNNVITTLLQKVEDAKVLFDSYPNMEYLFRFIYKDPDRYDPETQERMQFDESQMSALKLLTGQIELSFKFEHPTMEVHTTDNTFARDYEGSKSYGTIQFKKPVYLNFRLPLFELFQALYTSDLESVTESEIYGRLSHDSLMTKRNFLSIYGFGDLLNSRQTFNNNSVRGWFEDGNIRHPYINHRDNREDDSFECFDVWEVPDTSVCLGNMQNDMLNAFVQMDFIQLLTLIQQWNKYCMYNTNPLNNISYAFDRFISADDFSEDMFTDHVNFQFDTLHRQSMIDIGFNPNELDIKTTYQDSSWDRGGAFCYTNAFGYDQIGREDGVHFGIDMTSRDYRAHINSVRYYLDRYDNPDGEYIYDDIITAEDVATYESIKIALMQEWIDCLESNNCITSKYGKAYEVKQILDKINNVEMESETIEPVEEDDDDGWEPVVNPHADLPFGSDETIVASEFGTAEEIQSAMEQQMMEDM